MMILPSYQQDILPIKETQQQQQQQQRPPRIDAHEYDYDYDYYDGNSDDDSHNDKGDEENLPLMERRSSSSSLVGGQRVVSYYGNDDETTPLQQPLQPSSMTSSRRRPQQQLQQPPRRRQRRRRPIRIISRESICLLLLVGMAICVSYTTSKNDSRMTSWGDTNTGLLSRLLGTNSNKGNSSSSNNKNDDQLQPLEEMSGAVASALTNRIVDEASYIDIPNVSCDDIYYDKLFDSHNFITFQHTIGVHNNAMPIIITDDSNISNCFDNHRRNIYKMKYDDGLQHDTTVYVNNDDRNHIYNIVLIDGFDLFDTYHEQFQFVTLPFNNQADMATTTTNASNVQINENDDHMSDRHGGDGGGGAGVDIHTKTATTGSSTTTTDTTAVHTVGCRVFHTIIGLFSDHASTITREEWYETRRDDDQEMMIIYKFFTQQKR